jgi:hypothetical protein
VDRAGTTRESDTVRFTSKEVGLTKTIVLSSIAGLSEPVRDQRRSRVEGCISEEEQNGSGKNKLPFTSRVAAGLVVLMPTLAVLPAPDWYTTESPKGGAQPTRI